MKLRSIVDLVRAKGQRETTTAEFDQDTVTLGRGGSSDILYDSLLFSLEHARFSEHNGKLVVEDLDSLSGIRVNNHGVRRQELKAGDRVSIGDATLTVRSQPPFWEIYEERQEQEGEDSEERTKRLLGSISVKNAFPSMTVLSIVATVLIVVCFFFVPITAALNGVGQMVWTSGPISNPHKMIEDDCAACHAEAFEQVQDQTCLSCHEMTDHAEAFGSEEALSAHSEVRCAQCHMEHNGDEGIVLTELSLCTDCHAGLSERYAETDLEDVSVFASHPQFAVTVAKAGGEEGETHRVRLSDKENLVDGANLKLNHQVHLEEGIAGPDGPETLQCSDCHRMTPMTTIFEPIQYEKDCARCHPLEFDDRLPGNEVPHGDADIVYNYAYAEYAKLFLGDEQGPPVPGFERFKPGSAPKKREEKRTFVHNVVDEAARDAEELLFTKTACHLCHEISERPEEEFASERMSTGRYHILDPNIPQVWMPKARFDHSAHMEIACESCHEGVSESSETTDVLMPGVKSCQACHGDQHQTGMIQSDCVMCHSYHDQAVLPENKKREIKEIASMVMNQ